VSAAKRFRWIVLEDDENWRRLLQVCASKNLSSPVFVQSLGGLISELAQRPPHLISLDQHVPAQDGGVVSDMDKENGLRALEQIRASRPLVRTAIYTAYAKVDLAYRAGRTGADIYITKSVTTMQEPDGLSAADYMSLLEVLLQGGGQPHTNSKDPGYLHWALERGRSFLPPFLAFYCKNITILLNGDDWNSTFLQITKLREHIISFAWAHAAALCSAFQIKRTPVPQVGFTSISAVQKNLSELWKALDDAGRLGVWKGYVSDPDVESGWSGAGNALFNHTEMIRSLRNKYTHHEFNFSRDTYQQTQNGILAMIDALAFWADHPLMTNVKHHPSITGRLQFVQLAGPRPWPLVDLASSATLQGARAQSSERIHVLHRDDKGEHLVDLHPFVTMKSGANGGLLPCLLIPRLASNGPCWVSLLDYSRQTHLTVDAADAAVLNG
jgi:CheY-like chemotaxis protein